MTETISDAAALVASRIKDEMGNRTQGWLGQRVAEVEGRESPYSQPTAGDWIKRPELLTPARLFAIERALELEPGSLSRLFGYVPADAAPATSVEDAIEADPRLTRVERKALIGAYRSTIERNG